VAELSPQALGSFFVTSYDIPTTMSESESRVTTDGHLAVCLGIKHPSRAYNQIFITVKQLRVC
jgi:hypothetical protein